MRAREEALERLAMKRRQGLGGMSDDAFSELRLAVGNDPESFVEDDEERAFLSLAQALTANEKARGGEDFLDDDAYEASRTRRLGKLTTACKEALETSELCLDAATILALQRDDAGERLELLLTLASAWEADHPSRGSSTPVSLACGSAGRQPKSEAWDDVFARPYLRLKAAIAREYLNTTRFVSAREACRELVELSPSDPLGARYTWALVCARLEDEAGFDELDIMFDRRGNAWSHIARALLMFKLDRMPAARRALRGYARLCDGGSYALLRPTFVEAYLPDRPAFGTGTFEEAALAVHEADPVVVDTPDFIAWCSAQDGFAAEAQRYAEDHDLDW